MNSGPSEAAGSPPIPKPDLPGHFVSEGLQADCARFLDELRARIMFRRQLPPERTAWVPGRPNDPAPMDVSAEEAQEAAAQALPDFRSAHSAQ